MAHELEQDSEGRASMISVRLTPWHRLGEVLPEAPSFDEAMQAARLDYDLDLVPLHWHRAASVDDFVETLAPAKGIIRTDTNVMLGVVGEKYRPVSNAVAFEPIKPLLDTGVATIETGGVFRNGGDAWIMVKFADDQMGDDWKRLADRDPLKAYGLITTNHTGRRAVRISLTPVRVVCSNTLAMADSATAALSTVSHRGTEEAVAERLANAAQRIFLRTRERYEKAAGQYLQLQEKMITEAQFRSAVLDIVAPLPAGTLTGPRAELVIERTEARRNRLTELFHEGTGQDGDPTAWAAYNAVTEALDHSDGLWPTRKTRLAALGDGGAFAKLKQKAVRSLMTV